MIHEDSEDVLQRLFDLTCVSAFPPKAGFKADVSEMRLYWMACGIAYELNAVSMISDAAFDTMAKWLLPRRDWGGFPGADELRAGSAQAWASWPEDAHALATQLLSAYNHRISCLAGEVDVFCRECYNWVGPCTCHEEYQP